MVLKNVASQKQAFFAFTAATSLPRTGDAANISAFVKKDGGSLAALVDSAATEVSATDAPGFYEFELTAEETNADTLLFTAKSATSGVVVIGVPAIVYPSSEATLQIETTGTETADSSELILAKYNRGLTKDIVLLNAAGEAIVPVSGDKIRAYIGREGSLNDDLSGAEFLVTSDAATAAGSSFTKNTPAQSKNRLRIDATDLMFSPGFYTLFIDFYDSLDTNEWKSASRYSFVLERT